MTPVFASPRWTRAQSGPAHAGPDWALAGEQQRVGRLLGHPLDVLPGDAPLPRGHQHVLDAVLRDVGGAGDRVLRQTVHRPQPQDPPPGPGPSRDVEPPRSLDCMAARAYRGCAGRRLMAVQNGNIRSGGRRC